MQIICLYENGNYSKYRYLLSKETSQLLSVSHIEFAVIYRNEPEEGLLAQAAKPVKNLTSKQAVASSIPVLGTCLTGLGTTMSLPIVTSNFSMLTAVSEGICKYMYLLIIFNIDIDIIT